MRAAVAFPVEFVLLHWEDLFRQSGLDGLVATVFDLRQLQRLLQNVIIFIAAFSAGADDRTMVLAFLFYDGVQRL